MNDPTKLWPRIRRVLTLSTITAILAPLAYCTDIISKTLELPDKVAKFLAPKENASKAGAVSPTTIKPIVIPEPIVIPSPSPESVVEESELEKQIQKKKEEIRRKEAEIQGAGIR